MRRHVRFHLNDLPIHEFCVLLKEHLQKELIDKSATVVSDRRHGKYTYLSRYLKERCKSLRKTKVKSIIDMNISKWKSNRMFLPIDCVIEMCKIASVDMGYIEDNIILLKEINCYNSKGIPFNFLYDDSFAAIAECIKTEGHIKRDFNQCSISSENMEIINFFVDKLKDFGICSKSVYQYLRVEAKVPNVMIRKILKENGRALNFNVQKRRLKVTFCDSYYKCKTNKYSIIMGDGKRISIDVTIPDSSRISRKSSYGICSTCVTINITNKTFCKLMKILANVPEGKKSSHIELCSLITKSPDTVKITVINSVFATEGWVEEKARRIRFFVNSKKYVLQVKKILEQFGLNPTIDSRGYLSVTSRKDLSEFDKYFDMIIKEKNEKLSKILSSYKLVMFRHYEGINKIMNLIKKKEMTAKELSVELDRGKDAIFSHLNKGIEHGYIHTVRTRQPFRYYVTPKGLKLIGDDNDRFGH